MLYPIQSSTVKELSKYHLVTNITICSNWYKTIQKNGKPYLAAILILGEIVYWHKGMYVRDEVTGRERIEQKFKGDKLQIHYKQFTLKFGFTQWQIKKALAFLVNRGLLSLEKRNIEVDGIKVKNALLVDICTNSILEASLLN